MCEGSILAGKVGHLQCMLTAVSAGCLLVGILLKGFITMLGFSEFNFPILCSGTTINNRGKSEKSNKGLENRVVSCYVVIYYQVIYFT